ncbi:MAG: hypothetical protein ACI4DW_03675 [Lachnospiraceae bacterium]
MRVLRPEEGQTFLYFYKNEELEPSQDIATVKKLLRKLGCKVGPAWSRMVPEYYLCNCEAGEFKLVNDVPAIFLETEDSKVIEFLAEGLIRLCHIYPIGVEVRLKDESVVRIEDYYNEDYLVKGDGEIYQLPEREILCKKVIPDNIEGKRIRVCIKDSILYEVEEYEGVVLTVKSPLQTPENIAQIVIECDYYDSEFEEGNEKALPLGTVEEFIYENEIISIEVLE